MFSVVIPIYNHARFLPQAVWSALRAPLVSEILVLDDGSIDGSAQVASELASRHPEKIRDLTPDDRTNRGAHMRLNELVDRARNEWVAVLNSDDVLIAGRFEKIACDPHFAQSDFVFGDLLLIDQTGALIGAKRGPFNQGAPFPSSFDVPRMVAENQLLDLLSHQNYLGTTSNMVFRKSLHARIGGFSAHRYVHDWEFGLRAFSLGRHRYIQRFLTAYRLHSSNTILEGGNKVNAEARDMMERFVKDFPGSLERPQFRAGLQSNVSSVWPIAIP